MGSLFSCRGTGESLLTCSFPLYGCRTTHYGSQLLIRSWHLISKTSTTSKRSWRRRRHEAISHFSQLAVKILRPHIRYASSSWRAYWTSGLQASLCQLDNFLKMQCMHVTITNSPTTCYFQTAVAGFQTGMNEIFQPYRKQESEGSDVSLLMCIPLYIIFATVCQLLECLRNLNCYEVE